MPYKSEPKEYELHPLGQHEGIIYGWEDKGWHTGRWGPQHKAVIKIESLTATMKDGKPFGAFESIYLNFGSHKRRKNLSNFQTRREQISGRELTDNEFYDFDENDIIEVRVGYTIKHTKDNDGNDWANIDALWRLDDQEKGELQNEIQIINEPPPGFDEPTHDASQPTKQNEPDHSRPINSAPSIQSRPATQAPEESTPEQISYVGQIIDSLEEPGYLSNAEELRDWLASEPPLDELAKHLKELVGIAEKHSVALPEFETHPFSTGKDDLPF